MPSLSISADLEDLSNEARDCLIAFINSFRPPVEIDTDDPGNPELDDTEIDDLIERMHAVALEGEVERTFKTPELYRLTTNERWVDLASNSRKTLGRRFRKFCVSHSDEADFGDVVVQFDSRNLQNMAVYRVIVKE